MTESAIEISVIVTMQVPPQAMPFVVETLRTVFGKESTVEEARKCPSCGLFFVPRNIADPPGECPTCDHDRVIDNPCAAQMLGDGYSRHWAPCTDYPDGAVTDINGRVLSESEAEIVLQRWIDSHN